MPPYPKVMITIKTPEGSSNWESVKVMLTMEQEKKLLEAFEEMKEKVKKIIWPEEKT